MEEKPTYPANRDARAQLTEIESATSRRVHRLDRICGNKPAKLLDFKSLTLRSGSSRFGPVYLYITPQATAMRQWPTCAMLEIHARPGDHRDRADGNQRHRRRYHQVRAHRRLVRVASRRSPLRPASVYGPARQALVGNL